MEKNKIISNKILGISLCFVYIPIILFIIFIIGLSNVEAKPFDSGRIRGFDVNGSQIFSANSGFYSYSGSNFKYAIFNYNISNVNAGDTLTFNVKPASTFLVDNVNTHNISLTFTIQALTSSGSVIDITDSCSGSSVKTTNYENNSFGFTSNAVCTLAVPSALTQIAIRYVIGGNTTSVKSLVLNSGLTSSNYSTDPGEGTLIIQNAIENTNNIINALDEFTQDIVDAFTGGSLDDDTPIDDSGLKDYEETESGLVDEGNLNNINNIDISLDSNTSNFFWKLFTDIINTHTLIYGLIISVLSLGIVKLILDR